MADDKLKSKLILDDKNYFTPSNQTIDLIFEIRDQELFIETAHKYSQKFKNTPLRNGRELYEHLFSKLNGVLKAKLVQYEIDQKEDVDKDLLLSLLPEITDRVTLKQILSQELNKKYFRLYNETNINTINSIIADKIIEHGLADELLNETDINIFSEENKFLLLLNASKDVREKILKENKDLKEIINAITENEDIIKKISDGTSDSIGKLTFYNRLIAEINKQQEENSFTLSQKLAFLETFQEKHASIGQTIIFDFLENDILKEFGRIKKYRKFNKISRNTR